MVRLHDGIFEASTWDSIIQSVRERAGLPHPPCSATVSYEVVVNLIASTTTRQGLKVRAALVQREYPLGLDVTREQMADLHIERSNFHGEWNYTLRPK
ncbi:ISAzo13-like element transposase-related protein [Myxococcus vastator]|uniref:ISAzo13-like element transposase-related protein n=1 Tax=Myxococcus vastator TaxID=2709664 RepID=UPI0013D20717|nr:hypothetical protein [Myxococcus vastator]